MPMIGFHPDGLNIGPLVINWANLSLVLGVFTWLGLAKFPQAQTAALVTLIVARLWATLPGLSTQRPALENLWDILDLRRGGWAWWPGLSAALVYLLYQAWQDMKRIEQSAHHARSVPPDRRSILRTSLLPAALRAAVPALALGSVPLVLKPAPNQTALPNLTFTRLNGAPATLPRPAVVNLWATWCGPCRSEMPLLLSEAKKDPNLIMLNVGENTATIEKFLKSKPDQVWLGGQNLTSSMRVTGFPTTLAINAKGQVVARHLGPLSRAQLLTLQRQAQETP